MLLIQWIIFWHSMTFTVGVTLMMLSHDVFTNNRVSKIRSAEDPLY